MDAIRMLTTLFPTPREVLLSKLAGAKTQSTLPAADIAQSVMLTAASRDPNYVKRANLDADLLSQLGAYTQAGAIGAGAGASLTKLQKFAGMLHGDDNVHAIARSSQRVRVGDNSVVEAKGNGDVVAGDNAFVTGGDGSNTIRVGDKGVVVGGRARDNLYAGDHAMVRAGENHDIVMVGDGSVVSGDDGRDTVVVGSMSVVDGGADDDTLTASSGSEMAGGAGNDSITLTRSRNLADVNALGKVTGGQGRDTILLDRADADIVFNRGDGVDTVGGTIGGSTLLLKDARPGEVRVSLAYATGGRFDLVMKVGSNGDQITIKNAHLPENGTFMVAFRGGQELTLSELVTEALS